MTDNIHFKIKGGYQHDAYYHGIAFQRAWHQMKFKKAVSLLNVRADERVLDAACGSGVLSDLIAKSTRANITGVDFSEAAIGFCKAQYNHEHVKFIHADLQQKLFDEHSFDKVVMLEVIEHLTPEVATTILKNLYASLTEGGKLILSTPNKRSLWPVIEFLLDLFKMTPKMKGEQHVKLYAKDSLRAVLYQAGFKTVTINTTHFIAPWLSIFSFKLAWKVFSLEQKLKFLPGSLLFAVAEK